MREIEDFQEASLSVCSCPKMPFTITRNFGRVPSYPALCKLAEQNQIHVTGDERAGAFSSRGVQGDYEFREGGLSGTFAGHGVTGRFAFEIGSAVVTVTDKPFWVPEMLLKQKISEGLERLSNELA